MVDPSNRGQGSGGYDDRIREAQTAIGNLDTRIAVRREQLNKARAELDSVDAYGDVTPAATTRYNEVASDLANLTDERAGWVERRQSLQDEKASQPGQTPLTDVERAALNIELDTARSEASEAASNATLAGIEVKAAQAAAAAAADPTNQALVAAAAQLDTQVKQAGIVASQASTASQALRDSLAVQAQAIDNMLAPYRARQEAAGAITAESEATRAEALAQYAAQFAKAEADIQSGNATWQEIKNRMALVEEETQRILFDAGMPQNEIDQAFEDLKSKQITNEQTEAGPDATAVKQIKAAIKRGDMDPVAATELYYEQIGYGTPLERRQEGRANAMALNQSAISAGLYGPPGGLDAGGNLSRALKGVGIDYTPTPGKQMQLPQWAQSLGVDISAQQGVPSQPVFDEQGEMLPRTAFAQSLLPPPSVNMTPDELTAWVAGRKGEQPAPTPPTQAQAAVVTPDATGGTSGSKGTTKVTLPDGTVIEAAGGPPAEPAPPPPTHEDRGADDWWAGVTANPVLSAAAKYGEMQNAEAHESGLSKVTYVDSSVRWFDSQGQETTEPRMAGAPAGAGGVAAPPASAPPAPVVKPAASVKAPEPYVPTSPQVGPYPQYPVGPDRGDVPPRNGNNLPGIAPQAWPRRFGGLDRVRAPLFARSLMVAGGR